MNRFAVALGPATERHSSEFILGNLAFWAEEAGTYPDAFPIWWRLEDPPRSIEDQQRLIEGLWEVGVEPMLYLTSVDPELAVLKTWARELAGDLVIRYNQEPNGDWKAPWANVAPAEYIDDFRRVSDIVHEEAPGARMFYCPILKRKADLPEFELYYPGYACDIVGFDSYSQTSRPVEPRWARAVAELERIAPGKRIIVGETGIYRGTRRKRRWIRGLADVKGIETVCYMDVDMDEKKWPGHLWRMTPGMRQEYGRLMR